MSPSKRVLVRLAAAASVLALGACTTVGPNFKQPAAPAGASASGYAMAGDPAAPGVTLSPEARSAGPWWEAFGSPELNAVVRQALADSPTLAEANATLERAHAQYRAARGQQLPQLDANAGYNRERINIQAFGFTGFSAGITNPTIDLYSVGGAVAYDLDIFGGRRRTTEEAGARAEYEAHRADAAYLSLSGSVALQVMRIASLRAEIAAVESIIADDERVLDLVRKSTRAGGEAPAAIDTGSAQLAEDQALAPPLYRELDIARHQLALLVGKAPAEWSPPDFDFAKMTAPTTIPVSLPSSLIRARPDILAAEADLHASTAAVGVATANLYPDIRLSANLTQSAIDPSDLFNTSLASGWAIGPGLTAPIFHGGTLRAQKRAAEADARASLARYQQTVLRAFTEVSDLLAALGTDQQSIAALQRAVTASEASARNAQTAYSLGGGTLLQVTDAERQLSRTRRSLVAAQGQMYADLVQLYAATATDWRPAASST